MSLLPVLQTLNGTHRPKQTVNPSNAFPILDLSAIWPPPAQEHHGEYETVGNTGNVQVSEFHIEDAAECQENENQQNVETQPLERRGIDRKSTRLNSSHANISYAV